MVRREWLLYQESDQGAVHWWMLQKGRSLSRSKMDIEEHEQKEGQGVVFSESTILTYCTC